MTKHAASGQFLVTLLMVTYAPAAFASGGPVLLLPFVGSLVEVLLIGSFIAQMGVSAERWVVSTFFGMGIVASWSYALLLGAINISIFEFGLLVLGIPLLAFAVGILLATRVRTK
jgi:hypothetical protein